MIDREGLVLIVGGASSMSGTLLNAMAKLVSSALEIGRSLGSALRRASSGQLCPI